MCLLSKMILSSRTVDAKTSLAVILDCHFPYLSVVAEHVAVYGGDNRRFTTQRLP